VSIGGGIPVPRQAVQRSGTGVLEPTPTALDRVVFFASLPSVQQLRLIRVIRVIRGSTPPWLNQASLTPDGTDRHGWSIEEGIGLYCTRFPRIDVVCVVCGHKSFCSHSAFSGRMDMVPGRVCR
jgi:hypothetical protein